MKILIATLFLGLTTSPLAHGQTPAAAPPIEIDDLRTPTSPAFILLDVTPASVERPENAKALVLNLLSTASQSEGLPKDYALQLAPYWLKSHPNLTFGDYQDPDPVESMLRTMTISIATSPLLDKSVAKATTIGTRVGLGVRTNIIGGRPNPTLQEHLDTLKEIHLELLDSPDDPQLRAESRKVALEIQALDQQRVGLFVSAAAAQVWSVPQDDVDERQRDRWGVWVTPAYRFLACPSTSDSCKSVIDAIAVLRVIRDRDKDTQWDFGGRVLWQATDPFAISAEVVRRRGKEGTGRSSDRTVAIVEYRIREDLLLFGSFGKDFKDDDSSRTLVSILGLNFGFGAKPAVIAAP